MVRTWTTRQSTSVLRTSSRADVLNWPPWLKKVVLRTEGAKMLDLLKVTCRPDATADLMSSAER